MALILALLGGLLIAIRFSADKLRSSTFDHERNERNRLMEGVYASRELQEEIRVRLFDKKQTASILASIGPELTRVFGVSWGEILFNAPQPSSVNIYDFFNPWDIVLAILISHKGKLFRSPIHHFPMGRHQHEPLYGRTLRAWKIIESNIQKTRPDFEVYFCPVKHWDERLKRFVYDYGAVEQGALFWLECPAGVRPRKLWEPIYDDDNDSDNSYDSPPKNFSEYL